MYGVYHGPVGLKKIAERVNGLAKTLAAGLKGAGLQVRSCSLSRARALLFLFLSLFRAPSLASPLSFALARSISLSRALLLYLSIFLSLGASRCDS